MKLSRSSATTEALLGVLAERGVTITGRQLERWSQAGLLPPGEPPLSELADHLVQLIEVYRPGPGATERAALILAGRGAISTRYVEFVHTKYGQDIDPDAPFTSPWEWTDEKLRAVENNLSAFAGGDLVGAAGGGNPELPELGRAEKAFKAVTTYLLDAAKDAAEDAATENRLPPRVQVESGLMQVAYAIAGEPPLAPETMGPFFSTAEVDEAVELMPTLRRTMLGALAELRTADASYLLRGIALAHALVALAPPEWGVKGEDADILAALWGPVALALITAACQASGTQLPPARPGGLTRHD